MGKSRRKSPNKGRRESAAPRGRTLPAWAWYVLCFALSAAVMLWAYAAEGFYPFGDKSILSYDMAQQYVEYFCGLKKGDVFFSWSKAMGTSYIGVFSYYLSSPLSVLTLLVPNEAMPLGLMVLVILKVGLAGLSYAVFARYYFDRLDVCTLLCALGYALCTYAVAYSMCIMWLDGLIWLPIILLGLEWLLEGRRRWLFPASLAVCFFSTWYISYMIGGFCCLWFFFRAVSKGLKGKDLRRALGDFLLSAVWALCLTAWLWLPSFLSMTSGKLAVGDIDLRGTFTFSLEKLLPRFFYGNFEFFYDRALPYVFCGTGLFLAAVGYFFLEKRPGRERLAAGGVLAALVLSLWLSALDRVWHLFQVPHSFPYRYAFLVSFFVAFLAQHTLHALKDDLPRSAVRPAALVMAVLLCWEMGANARLVFRTVDRAEPYGSYAAYVRDYRRNAALVAAAQGEEEGFFRMGATRDRGLNSPLSFGYNGVTHYSSLYNQSLNKTLRGLGMAQNWYWSAYYGSSHFTDALFDIRYVISDRAVPGYANMAQEDGLGLYENPSTLPLAFLARSAPDGVGGTPVERQNELFSALTGEEEALFTPADPQVDTHEGWSLLTYTGTGRPIYLDLTDRAVTDLQLDGQSLLRYPTYTAKSRCLHCLGAPAAGETLQVIVTYTGSWEAAGKSYECDLELLARGVDKLQNTDLASVKNGRVELTAGLEGEDRTLVTTIPAEAGWSAKVDGKRVPLRAWLDGTFLAVDLAAGDRHVTLCYTPPGLPLGLCLGAAALLWAGAVWVRRRRGTRNG